MDQPQHLRDELAFLVDQRDQTQSKIERAKDALSTCEDCLEEAALREMVKSAQQELAWLNNLIDQIAKLDPSLSLESLIMTQIADTRRARNTHMGGWRRGKPTPAGYWEAETRLADLNTLLARYHAWVNASSDEGADLFMTPGTEFTSSEKHTNSIPQIWVSANPTPNGTEAADGLPRPGNSLSLDPLLAIEDAVYQALDRAGSPPGYIEVVVESPEMVIVRGSARSPEERDALLAAVMTVEAVQKVLSDIYVLSANQKPAVLFSRRPRDESHPNSQ